MSGRTVAAFLLVAWFAWIPGCGGGEDPDRKELERLRVEAELMVEDSAAEKLVTDALAIASRNADKPLGDEAFEFAEQTFLDWYEMVEEGLFADRAAEAPDDVTDPYLDSFQRLAGFLEVAPAGYEAEDTQKVLHRRLTERAEFYLFRLEESLDNRELWVAELNANGTTKRSFLGQETEDGFAEYGATLEYLRTLAADCGEPAKFLAGLDALRAAVAVADFRPPALKTSYQNGVLVTTYTPEAVAAGSKNVAELTVAVAAAQEAMAEAAEAD